MKTSVPELTDQSESDSTIGSVRATLEAEGELKALSSHPPPVLKRQCIWDRRPRLECLECARTHDDVDGLERLLHRELT